MTETHIAIHQIIRGGEGPRVEFKAQFTTALDREIAALANGGGGDILIGIADDSAIVGLSETPQRLEERVMASAVPIFSRPSRQPWRLCRFQKGQ